MAPHLSFPSKAAGFTHEAPISSSKSPPIKLKTRSEGKGQPVAFQACDIGPDLELLPSFLGQVWEWPKQVRGPLSWSYSCSVSACVPISRPLLLQVHSVELLHHQPVLCKVAPCILPLAQVVTETGKSGHRGMPSSELQTVRSKAGAQA